MSASVIKPIIEQHAENAAFLWIQRDAAVSEPHYSLKDLAHLDDRLEAHIDGLRIAGDVGWEICQEALALEEPGEVFIAALLAFESEDGRWLDEAVSVGEKTPETWRALVSAISWVGTEHFQRWAPAMQRSSRSSYKQLVMAGDAAHRRDPGNALMLALNDSDPVCLARALRAVGQLKRHDLLPYLQQHFTSEDNSCRFWAAQSAALLGNSDALEVLKTFAQAESSYCEQALQVLLRRMPAPDAVTWLRVLSENPGARRLAVLGAGIIGDPLYIPWLIKLMGVPELARLAGESFSMITGVDLAYDDLEGEWPEGFEAGPTENPEDENVEMDQDEDLPWPEPALLEVWWQNNEANFQTGQRYLVGSIISEEHCKKVLTSGFQRQRRAAALELALLQKDVPLFNVFAEGANQQRRLKQGVV